MKGVYANLRVDCLNKPARIIDGIAKPKGDISEMRAQNVLLKENFKKVKEKFSE